MPRGVYPRTAPRTVCLTCLTELPTEASRDRHPREARHALIPLSTQQVEAWERGGCIVTVNLDNGWGQRACGEPVVDGRLCEGHAAQKARLSVNQWGRNVDSPRSNREFSPGGER